MVMAWKWIVRRTRESKPFFLAFATICGVVPGVIGYGVMQLTNTRKEKLESHLRTNARPESLRQWRTHIGANVRKCRHKNSFAEDREPAHAVVAIRVGEVTSALEDPVMEVWPSFSSSSSAFNFCRSIRQQQQFTALHF